MNEIKIRIISDLHCGEKKNISGRKLNQPAQSLINITRLLKKDEKFDLTVFLGDQISKKNKKKDLEHLMVIKNLVDKFKIPSRFVIGNHDLINFNKKEMNLLLENENAYFEKIIDNIQLIFLDVMHEGYSLCVDEAQLSWLQKKLHSNYKKTIIFSHAPLYEYNVTGNVWLDGRPDKACIQNHEEVLSLLKSFDKNIICINGHIHENNFKQVGKISFIGIQSFSENISNEDDGPACQTYAKIYIRPNKFILKMVNDLTKYELEF